MIYNNYVMSMETLQKITPNVCRNKRVQWNKTEFITFITSNMIVSKNKH